MNIAISRLWQNHSFCIAITIGRRAHVPLATHAMIGEQSEELLFRVKDLTLAPALKRLSVARRWPSTCYSYLARKCPMTCDACLPQSRKILVSLAALLLLTLAGAAAAEDPEVQFDCDPVVVCYDITPVDFSLSNPDEKIIEATVRISTRMTAGATSDLTELVYEIQRKFIHRH